MTKQEITTSILLIDDEPFAVSLATMALGNLGYNKVVTAIDGNSALGLLITTERPFDIIICDLNMPEMDGVEFIRHTGESGFTGGFIFLSGEGGRMLDSALGLAKAHSINVLGALSKPLRADALGEILGKYSPAPPKAHIAVEQRSISEDDLRSGLKGSARNELMLVYHPKVQLSSGKISGVEVLARWWNFERGALDPVAFIPLAKKSNLIDELTCEIYKRTLKQISEWKENGLFLKASINVSVSSFSDPKYFDFLVSTAKVHEVDPGQIVFEVSETKSDVLPANGLETLLKIRLQGFGLSIDNFGTNGSSLMLLKEIPFSELKIDRTFTNGTVKDSTSRKMLESCISLAKNLELEVVAEGIETKEDWELMKSLNCDCVQGFYCSKPMRSEDLPDFIRAWNGSD